MTIVWFSRHEPTSRQLAALKSLYSTAPTIVRDTAAFDTASDIEARFRASGADEMVLVAPLAVVQALVKRGLHPLWAQMEQCAASHPEREVTITPRSSKPRHYRFIKFWRINSIKLDLHEITSTRPKTKKNAPSSTPKGLTA